MRHIAWSLAAFVAICSAPAGAALQASSGAPSAKAPAPALSPPSPARTALARELVGHTQPKELMIEAVLFGWNKGVAEQDAADLGALDKIQAGLSGRFIDRGRAEIVAIVSERIPEMHSQIAAIYADNCTEEELKALIAFYSSPVGKKLIRSMTMSISGSDPFEDDKVTAAEATQANREAAREAVKTLSGDEWIEAAKFGLSPTGRKVKSLAPKVQAAAADWMTRLMADYGTRMETIAEEMVGKAIEEADKTAEAD